MITLPEACVTASPPWLIPNTILLTEVGSRAHGTSVDDGQDDSDHMGIVIEPIEYVVGLKKFEQFQWRTKPEGVRSEAGDLDLTIFSLQKWMRLALDGNPSVLIPLMVQGSNVYHLTPWGEALRHYTPDSSYAGLWFIPSKQAGPRFLGYLKAQRERLLGTRGGKHGGKGRPELEQAHGFDTKFAMHMLRIGYSGIEYMETGRFSEPVAGETGEFLRAVRSGEYTKDECLADAEVVEERLKRAIDSSPLPDVPNYEAANRFLIDAYEDMWGYE